MDQLLDHKNNPLECWKKSLKHYFRQIIKTFRQTVRSERLDKKLEKPLAIR